MGKKLRFIYFFLLEMTRRLLYFTIISLALYGVVYLAHYSYYAFLPGKWFFNVKSATATSISINQPLPFTLCRQIRYPKISADDNITTRSYFKLVGSNQPESSGEYAFSPGYEGNNTCQVIMIPATKHPNKGGTYYIYTSIDFYVSYEGYRFKKTANYTSKPFKISDTTQSLQDRIIELENQIEQLKDILRSRGVTVPESQPANNTTQDTQQQTIIQPQSQLIPNNQSSLTTIQSTNTIQPEATTLTSGLLNLVQKINNGTLNSVQGAANSLDKGLEGAKK